MKKIIFFMVCPVLLAGGLCRAQVTQAKLFAQANDAYTREDYSRAVVLYEQILDSGTAGGAVLYNLGNACFKDNDLGCAVLNYERALQYIPRDADLRANYAYALSLTERIEAGSSGNIFVKMLQHHFQLYTINELTWILTGLAGLLAAVHLCALYLSWRPGRKTAVISLMSAVILFYAYGFAAALNHARDRAVVLEDAQARFEPRDDATVHFSIFEGNAAKVVQQENEWVKIKRFDGKTGWIKSAMIKGI